jgi:hypothetical protein
VASAYGKSGKWHRLSLETHTVPQPA